jgi:hypothetical protein
MARQFTCSHCGRAIAVGENAFFTQEPFYSRCFCMRCLDEFLICILPDIIQQYRHIEADGTTAYTYGNNTYTSLNIFLQAAGLLLAAPYMKPNA